MSLIMKNVKLIDSLESAAKDVLIEDGKIKQIGENIKCDTASIIQGKGRLLIPGMIDLHIHLREPGGEHKETIESGTKAAARGGFTVVAAMPNTSPVPDSVEILQNVLDKINEDAHVHVLPYASISKDLKGEELTDIEALAETGAFAFTDDGVGIQTAEMMFEAMKIASKVNKPIVAHCEDNSLIYSGVVHEGEVSRRLDLPGIPSICESVQIARDVLLAEAADCHYHVCHVSTKESVRVIRDAKKAGIRVTAEVTPHHLLLNEQNIVTVDPNFKMNPPLRSQADQEALLEGLLDGTIDFIATDHAPHTEEEKSQGMLHSPFGIVGLETAFPLLYTYLVKENKLTLKEVVDHLTINPARAFGLPFGKIEVGVPADVVLIDLNMETKVDKHSFYSKSMNTPFDQWPIAGIPVLTMVNGEVVYEAKSAK